MRRQNNPQKVCTQPLPATTAAFWLRTMGERAYRGFEPHRGTSPATVWLLLLIPPLCFPLDLCGQATVSTGKMRDAGAASRQQSLPRDAATATEYVIDAYDVLNVDVVDVPQLSRDYRVAPDGTITIPLLASPLKAEGLTLTQFSAVISSRLRAAELVSQPNVVVSVKSSQRHAIAVAGAVRNPQIFPVLGPTTLLDVLSQAGGLAPDAGGTAIITRHDQATASSWLTGDSSALPVEGTIKVNLQKLLATGDPALNPVIYPGDKVTVQRAGVVYVVGAVHRAGGFPMSNGRDEMTVLQAVALGEGLKSTALQKRAMIIRRGSQFPGGRKEIPVDLKRILSGHASDPGLEANDILFIPDSASKRALHRGAEAAVQIATGVAIWGRY
ncbi:MAG TPA: polysaccharide biosynthesis/export family protein [Terriglobia bacterium]|nr:polysaccharide biosynthesis/export family protein [Terriglobia bacterium]